MFLVNVERIFFLPLLRHFTFFDQNVRRRFVKSKKKRFLSQKLIQLLMASREIILFPSKLFFRESKEQYSRPIKKSIR